MTSETVAIQMSADEALVHFEFLSRFCADKKLEIEHRTETPVLCGIHCRLERHLIAPLAPKYCELVSQARDRLGQSGKILS